LDGRLEVVVEILGCAQRKPREQCGDLGSQTDKQGADMAFNERKQLHIKQMVRKSFNIQSISKEISESRYNYKTLKHVTIASTLHNCLFTRPTEAGIL
jgi:hypothetical protein